MWCLTQHSSPVPLQWHLTFSENLWGIWEGVLGEPQQTIPCASHGLFNSRTLYPISRHHYVGDTIRGESNYTPYSIQSPSSTMDSPLRFWEFPSYAVHLWGGISHLFKLHYKLNAFRVKCQVFYLISFRSLGRTSIGGSVSHPTSVYSYS
jgi:hypothetical protein